MYILKKMIKKENGINDTGTRAAYSVRKWWFTDEIIGRGEKNKKITFSIILTVSDVWEGNKWATF